MILNFFTLQLGLEYLLTQDFSLLVIPTATVRNLDIITPIISLSYTVAIASSTNSVVMLTQFTSVQFT